MDNIIDIFNHILHQADSIDVADFEFKKLINEDADIKQMYRQWCHEVGSSEKNGFLDYCDEYMESRDSIWDTLNDYDAE